MLTDFKFAVVMTHPRHLLDSPGAVEESFKVMIEAEADTEWEAFSAAMDDVESGLHVDPSHPLVPKRESYRADFTRPKPGINRVWVCKILFC